MKIEEETTAVIQGYQSQIIYFSLIPILLALPINLKKSIKVTVKMT